MEDAPAKTLQLELMQGDCLEKLKLLPTDSVDLLLTDPPYNLGLFMKNRATNLAMMRSNYFGAAGWDNESAESWERLMTDFFVEVSRVLKKGGSAVIFMAIMKVETLVRLAEPSGLYYKTTGIWHKKNPMPRNMHLHFVNSTEAWVYFTHKARRGVFNNDGRLLHDFVETPVTSAAEKKMGRHPTQKPLLLMRYFVETLSNPGDVVLDPFMGSGSSGKAAVEVGRSFVGIELDPEYFEIARKRICAE